MQFHLQINSKTSFCHLLYRFELVIWATESNLAVSAKSFDKCENSETVVLSKRTFKKKIK